MDNFHIIKTTVGNVLIDKNYDVPLLGSSAEKPSHTGMPIIYVDRDWNPVTNIEGKKMDRMPFLAEHEAVERHKELQGMDYTDAHNIAERHENQLVHDAGIDYEKYEHSYIPDLRAAGSKPEKDLRLPPDMIEKPYEHPHNVRQREILGQVKAKENENP